MKIIFCLPGNTFSSSYFTSWNSTISELTRLGHSYAYCMGYDPVVYYARNRLLGGQNTAGKTQQPWQGQIQYDWMVWIDSDIVWQPNDVIKLISSDKKIVSGTYLMADNQNYAIVEDLDFNHLFDTGTFRFMDRDAMATKSEPFKASYTGFGFLAMRYGIVESMEYPWFRPRWIDQGTFHDFCAEDVGFCWTAQDLGHEIWVDPSIRVGHEKTMVL